MQKCILLIYCIQLNEEEISQNAHTHCKKSFTNRQKNLILGWGNKISFYYSILLIATCSINVGRALIQEICCDFKHSS